MSYNVLKGAVEGSVDQHADQEINGVKVFKNTISASVFYDTDAQSACTTFKDVAITKIKGKSKNSLLIFDEGTSVRSHHNLTFNGEELSTKNIRADRFAGSAEGLTNIPTDRFTGKISANDINYGRGLHEVRGFLQIKPGTGIVMQDGALSVNLNPLCGLSVRDGVLTADPPKAPPVNSEGQSLSDNDVFSIFDESRGTVCSTTLSNFYDSYIDAKMPHSSGDIGAIQLKAKKGFDSSAKLTYNTVDNTLRAEGTVSTVNLKVDSNLHCRGAVFKNIRKTQDKVYQVQDTDYTVLCDTKQSIITVMLPPACNNTGRVLTVKKANADKYKINSNEVRVKVEEGVIDLNDTVNIKMNYSSRTFQSDGENWWVIGAKGS